MAPFNWPRPPNLNELSTDEAVSATQKYVHHVQIHMGGLQLNSTEYGVLIGFMLSALSDATKIFDVVYQDSATSPDIRHGIDNFGLAMQSLATYMGHISSTPEPRHPAYEGPGYQFEDIAHSEHGDVPKATFYQEQTAIESNEDREARTVQIDLCNTDPAKSALERMSAEQLKRQLFQDFHDQGISVPLLSCSISRDCQYVLIVTSGESNAAILRDPSIWKPTLLGEHAVVVATRPVQDAVDTVTTSSLQHLIRTRRAEGKAEKNARLVWLEIPDRDFAKAKLVAEPVNQTRSIIEWELQHKHIEVRIERLKKSGACNHIRLWTVSTEEADILVNQWKPEWFGNGAFVFYKPEEEQRRSRHSAPYPLEDIRDDDDDAEIPAGLLDAPPPAPPSIENPKSRREVFVKILDQQYAEDRLIGSPLASLKALARKDLQDQGIHVRIASCQIVASGSFARLRTREPEEAEYLKTPGAWIP